MHDAMRRRGLTAAGLSGLVAPWSWALASGETAPTLRLGQSLPLSGPHAVLGIPVRAAAKFAFEELAQPRARGPRVQLISVDDGGHPERTAVNVKLLASEQRVHALFGFVGGGADRVGARAAAAEGLPYVAPLSGAVELRSRNSPGTFTFRASHADEIRYIARHVETINVTRLALVYEYNFMGWELRDTVLDLMGTGAGREVALTSIDREGSPYSVPGAVAAVLAKRPQAIILGSNAVASAAVVKALRAEGYAGYLYALSSVGTQALGDLLGPWVTGIAVTTVVPFALSDKTAVARRHRKFCLRHGLSPSAHSMEAWLAANLFVEAVKGLGAVTPDAIAGMLNVAPPMDFGDYTCQWHGAQPNPRAAVSLAVYDRNGRLLV
jgi:ABC-type branched-subunit amino acid transport system substrate-binding protein